MEDLPRLLPDELLANSGSVSTTQVGGPAPIQSNPATHGVGEINRNDSREFTIPISVDPTTMQCGDSSAIALRALCRAGRASEASQMEDSASLLPDDLLAAVLRHLAPRSLAASRCVSKAWRALIDDRGLLRADLLPLSLAGLFLCFSDYLNDMEFTRLFARPQADAADYSVPTYAADHCNGLILEIDSVLNPATRRRAYWPEPPPSRFEEDCPEQYLAFDPTVSPHYEVFLFPCVPDDPALLVSEWPPSPFVLRVFSSRTGRWEERSFVREGEAAGKVADMQKLDKRITENRHGVYWRGALYVHCPHDFVVRLSLSDHKYRVTKPPRGIVTDYCKELHIGKSQKGVYCALVDDKSHLWVWILEGSGEQMEWVVKHHSGFGLDSRSLDCHQRVHEPWTLANTDCSEGASDESQVVEQEHEWNSDDENIVPSEGKVKECHPHYVGFLGFHPYKEIVFLHRSITRGLAYHLNSSKLEDLGNLYPKTYNHIEFMKNSFPYTPCWMGDL